MCELKYTYINKRNQMPLCYRDAHMNFALDFKAFCMYENNMYGKFNVIYVINN